MENVQLSFFYNYKAIVASSGFYRKYNAIFSALDLSSFPGANGGPGCTGYSRRAILRAFIVKHLQGIKSVPRLIEYLDAHPILTQMCGFRMGDIPDESQLYRFLKKTRNSDLHQIQLQINRELIEKEIVTLRQFSMDSKPVKAATRHNNIKNPGRSRDKNKKVRRNPEATLGYYSYRRKSDGSKQTEFLWGYRTHVIVSKEGIPLVEVTLPNSYTDAKVAKRLIKKLKRLYRFKKGAIFLADAAYDVRDIYDLIVHEMKGEAFIPLNPRNTQEPKTLGPHGCPLCEAGVEMAFAGAWTEKSRRRVKFRCALKVESQLAEKHPDGCPVSDPRFSQGAAYGCTKYLDVTDDARNRVPRNSPLFKETYKQRQGVEQYFSRLGDREVEQTTHYKLRVVKNQMTIAHLTMSIVALAAVQLGCPDKIRCYRTFASAA